MNKKSTITIITVVLVVLWAALGVLNYSQVKNMKLPSLSWPGGVDDLGRITYFGAGYSFIIEGDTDEDGKITDIDSMEMYVLGVRVADVEAE